MRKAHGQNCIDHGYPLLLETYRSMVLLLMLDVHGHRLHFRRAQRKTAVAILPVERPQGGALGVDPLGGSGFDGFKQIGQA